MDLDNASSADDDDTEDMNISRETERAKERLNDKDTRILEDFSGG